jgi:hypothetical protein
VNVGLPHAGFGMIPIEIMQNLHVNSRIYLSGIVPDNMALTIRNVYKAKSFLQILHERFSQCGVRTESDRRQTSKSSFLLTRAKPYFLYDGWHVHCFIAFTMLVTIKNVFRERQGLQHEKSMRENVRRHKATKKHQTLYDVLWRRPLSLSNTWQSLSGNIFLNEPCLPVNAFCIS